MTFSLPMGKGLLLVDVAKARPRARTPVKVWEVVPRLDNNHYMKTARLKLIDINELIVFD